MRLPSDGDKTGRDLGREEIERLIEVVESGTLNCTKGRAVTEFERRFAERYRVPFARANASGTASVHTAVAAIDPEPGDEIVTTPITDVGAITPIVYQTAIPVFADVDPLTYNVTAETIAPKITDRTRAIIVTHLFGNPCDMGPILELAADHGLPVIEDAAQAFGAEWNGRPVGTIGDIGCFSLQQGKHMTTGEGGIVIAPNDKYARRMRLFIDKAWGYGDPNPDHYFLALNYRMTELQGAVALAQLDKLDGVVEKRIQIARELTDRISGIPGVSPPKTTPGCKHSYWKYAVRVDERVIEGGVDAFSSRLQELGVFNAPRYIKKPAFMLQVFRERKTFGSSGFPFEGPHRKGLPPVSYDPADYPGAREALARVVVVPINELYTDEHIDFVARRIREAAQGLDRVGR
jgi:dTDP-4-amino-4,6-dideoxygalactose transaminase